jgi:hypothetical protein
MGFIMNPSWNPYIFDMSFTMSVNNEKIFTFYDKHRNINFEEVNCNFVDLLEKCTFAIPTVSQSEMYQNIADISTKITAEFDKKLTNFRNGSVEELKIILQNNNNEKIAPMIKEYLDNLQQNTKIIMYENKNTDTITKHFDMLKLSIQEEMEKQKEIHCSLTKLLENMGNSSTKGRISENNVYSIILKLFPTAEIEYVGTEHGMGDIIFKRTDKTDIMIENKDYARNVNNVEIEKFKRDAENINSSAILLAQRNGIVNKENFQIEIVNNNVYIYIHNVNYSAEKIKMAIDIIDHLKKEMVITDKNINMDQETLKLINEEYNNFVKNKIVILNNIELFNKNINKSINQLQLPNITKYLANCGCTREYVKEWNCRLCDKSFQSEKGLKNHLRVCKV